MASATIELEFPISEGNVTEGITVARPMGHLTDTGFTFYRGTGAAFDGAIQVSVNQLNWDTLHPLYLSGSGEIDPRYRWIRLSITAAGAVGTDTQALVAGRELR